MLDHLRRMTAGSYGPYEVSMWVMELLVLALIAYEVVHNFRKERKDHRRQALLNERVLALSRCMDNGQRLLSSIPNPQYAKDFAKVQEWIDAARTWAEETNAFIALHSMGASAAFSLITDSEKVAPLVYGPSGASFGLYGHTRECYQRLVVQLENLRRIIERPEAYF